MSVDPARLDSSRMRARPIPCTAVGIALSGGGIRSAAFCLGALQALDFHHVVPHADYLSTVSGGGYIGACVTAGMSQNNGKFPFGTSDVRDNDAIGHWITRSEIQISRTKTPAINSSLRSNSKSIARLATMSSMAFSQAPTKCPS
jgi:predicted acylesterase/phospholipase RssA